MQPNDPDTTFRDSLLIWPCFDISLHPLFWWVTAHKIYPSSRLDDSTAVSWIMWGWRVPTSSRVKHPCIISELALYIWNSAFVDSANQGLCTVEPLYWIRSACDWTCYWKVNCCWVTPLCLTLRDLNANQLLNIYIYKKTRVSISLTFLYMINNLYWAWWLTYMTSC